VCGACGVGCGGRAEVGWLGGGMGCYAGLRGGIGWGGGVGRVAGRVWGEVEGLGFGGACVVGGLRVWWGARCRGGG